MNYDYIAEIIGNELIKYNVGDESFNDIYEMCLKNHGNFTVGEANKILTKVIHVITVMGYDIDSTKPCRFKKFMN